jgi:hypothetical protein
MLPVGLRETLRTAAIGALLLLAACATNRTQPQGGPGLPPPPPPPPPPVGRVLLDWRAIIRPAELGRLDRLDDAWITAAREARAESHGDRMRELGDLTRADAAVPDPAPQVGLYRCRTVKLGSKSPGMPSLVAYGWFKCRIEMTSKGLKFSKTSGSQRPSGLLFPDNGRRMIVLGSVSLGEEAAANAYGLHPERDFVGVLERMPRGGWRIVMPWPYLESNLDLIELQPAS